MELSGLMNIFGIIADTLMITSSEDKNNLKEENHKNMDSDQRQQGYQSRKEEMKNIREQRSQRRTKKKSMV